MVMAKAFAYGSGTIEIPKLLQFNNVDYIGVAYTDEGVELRKNGIVEEILATLPVGETIIIHYFMYDNGLFYQIISYQFKLNKLILCISFIF